MFQFLTTYRKDFTWPFVRSLALRPIPVGLKYSSTPDPNGPAGPKYMSYEQYQELVEERNRCIRESGQLTEEVQNGGGSSGSGPQGGSSRPPGQGRMPGPTSNSANPCQMSPAQINVTAQQLRQLQEKHPYLFNVLRSCPPDDLIKRVFNDRYRSVYMVDYGKEAEYPNLEYDRLVELAGQSANQGLAFCPCRDAIKSKYQNDTAGIVTTNKRGQNNECDALTVHKPQRRDTRREGEHDEVCLCGETTNIPRYGRTEIVTKKDRAAEEFLKASKGDVKGRSGGWGSGGGGGGGGSSRGWGSSGGKAGGGSSGGGSGLGGNDKGGGARRAKIAKLSYNTEYKEAFGKLGEVIINSRLHAGTGNDKKDPTTCE